MRQGARASQKGMTLVEVLVAFAILSGIVLSVMVLVGQNAQYMLSAEQRVLASVAVDNMLTRDLAVREIPAPGETQGEASVAGRVFEYRRTISEIGDQAILIEYRVIAEGGTQTIARGSALKATP